MPTSRTGATLPTDRAFVVQLTADARPSEARFLGRVEHIRSGTSSRFTSVSELLAFVTQVVEGADGRPQDAAREEEQ